jgi:DNA-binding CsgD family transcriptional regulator
MSATKVLSDKSRDILEMLGAGHSYDQVLSLRDDVTYLDICAAAREALELLPADSGYGERIAAIKHAHPRAYEPWSRDEEERLRALRSQGMTLNAIAGTLQRQPSAVQSRLTRLGIPTSET